jgi:hypothetical protein
VDRDPAGNRRHTGRSTPARADHAHPPDEESGIRENFAAFIGRPGRDHFEGPHVFVAHCDTTQPASVPCVLVASRVSNSAPSNRWYLSSAAVRAPEVPGAFDARRMAPSVAGVRDLVAKASHARPTGRL